MSGTTGEELDTAEFQAALAHILVDDAARQRLAEDPARFRAEFALSELQLAALQRAGLERLQSFAMDVADKRVAIFAKMCPNTFELLRRNDLLHAVVPRFLAEHPPRVSPAHANRSVRDFFWFTEFLGRLLDRGELSCDYLEGVLRCERLQGRLSSVPEAVRSARRSREASEARGELSAEDVLAGRPRLGAHAAVETFSYDIVQIMRCLASREALPALPASTTTLLLVKTTGWRRVQVVAINDLMRRLIALCDGTRTTAEIAREIAREHAGSAEPARVTEGCVSAVREMVRHHAILLEGDPAS
ncbi:hypothetical protein WME90_16495 [Sorangium sp. So ce375]|uniref:hypothetical protein n=1 Tax=Sorangium sp. So ce375 TaxID=3133306 RepID=UPI003F5AF1C4